MSPQVYDVAIIGGGINGCGIAADAALRGLSVILFEKDDLASKTSSSSSKLIHGGLRYLELYDFALVKKALNERQLLLNLAPHLVYPFPFVLPYQPKMRSSWFLRTGLFIYDHLSQKSKLPKSKLIRRQQDSPFFSPLLEHYKKGFLFYDCRTDDTRLTLANALQAKKYGASIHSRTEVLATSVINNYWQLRVQTKSKEEQIIQARSIVNAAGPWVESINKLIGISNKIKISLVQGSHLVVPKLYNGDHAYFLQNDDQRIVFIIPYYGHTMIGTTEVDFSGKLDQISISSEEVIYLCQLVNRYFSKFIKKEQIIHSWSGVRPLIFSDQEKLSSLSRDYIIQYSPIPAPAITVYGGKITTYRQSSLDAVDQLQILFPNLGKSQSASTPLPGASAPNWTFQQYKEHARKKYFWLDKRLRERYLNTYGTCTEFLLADCHQIEDLGRHFGQDLYQVEVDYLRREEWAQSSEDILWRRTKLGLSFLSSNKQGLDEYLT